MEWYLVWRLLKWLGLSMWAMGLYQVAANPRQDERLRALYSLAVFGFALTWMAGWLMMKHLGVSMGASWISNAMLLGLVSMVGTFLRAFSVVKGRVYNAMMWTGFALSMAMMVVRTGDNATLGVAIGVALIFGVLMTIRVSSVNIKVPVDAIELQVVQGFKWMAWVEGLTVLVLFLFYLPAKKLLSINLDGGTGLIGWTHGVFVILYVLSLTFTFRTLKWSWMQYIGGGFSSFFPFGTFVFERRIFSAPKLTESVSKDNT